jgi:hypothetical protein
MFEFKPDYDQTKARIDAFWRREVLDRPVAMFTIPKPVGEQVLLPVSRHPDLASRWMDIPYQVERTIAGMRNTEFLGDSLPIAFPNIGPEIFSSFYGCKLHFGEDTSWSDPILEDWSHADRIAVDWNSPYLRWLHEMTDAFLEAGKGRFITGMADWHPGGDAIAAFRDPQQLAMDMIENLEAVKKLLARLERDYFQIYDIFYEKLKAAGQPITSWTPLVSDGRYYIPSNDFSIMVSKAMYDDVFLPGIRRECQFLDHSIYHLDGPGALRHLDSLLAIPELDALQWVFGAGNEGFSRWVWVYKKAQAAGKGIQVICTFDEIDAIMNALSPCGMFLSISEVPSREAGWAMLKKLEDWTGQWRKSKGV